MNKNKNIIQIAITSLIDDAHADNMLQMMTCDGIKEAPDVDIQRKLLFGNFIIDRDGVCQEHFGKSYLDCLSERVRYLSENNIDLRNAITFAYIEGGV